MGLSNLKVKEHIDHWSNELSLPKASAYRAKWPKYLFHHASLHNACKILEAKALLSRNDLGDIEHDDVAPSEIINSRIDAHRYARLYFRPKNPTQYNVEGIRKPHEYYLSDPKAHIPMLYMFILSAESVLKLKSTQFSNGNMQSSLTQTDDTEAFFEKIPFDKVFHDGSILQAEEKSKIVAARCAEVLATSPLDLIEHLKFVFCRSDAERLSLIHTCKDIYPFLKPRIRTFTEIGVFESRFAYIPNVDLTYSSCIIKFSPRRDGQSITVELQLLNSLRKEVVRVAPTTVDPAKGLVAPFELLRNDHYLVRIKIDSHLAYNNEHILDDTPF